MAEPRVRRKSTGGLLRRTQKDDSVEREAVLAEARAKAQSKFLSRPDQRLEKGRSAASASPAATARRPNKAGGVKAICENLLGSLRKPNNKKVSSTKLRSASDAGVLAEQEGSSPKGLQARRSTVSTGAPGENSSTTTTTSTTTTSTTSNASTSSYLSSTPSSSPPSSSSAASSASSSPALSRSRRSESAAISDEGDAAASGALSSRRAAFAVSAVVIREPTKDGAAGEVREMTLEEEEEYLMAMMEGDVGGMERMRRNTVITKRETRAVEEGRKRHQRSNFRVTHVDYPDEDSYGRGFHDEVDLAFVANDEGLKDYVWGVGGAGQLSESEEEAEEDDEEDEEEDEEAGGKGDQAGARCKRKRRPTGDESVESSSVRQARATSVVIGVRQAERKTPTL